MGFRYAEPNEAAYRYPLTIGGLLSSALATAPTQEIAYRDGPRFTYRAFADRVARLAAGLTGLGAEPGMTVSVLDWDSHRYLECYFAVPMLGAVLHTVNVRLSPDEILYTLQHARAEILIVHPDFAEMVAGLRDRLGDVRIVAIAPDGSDASSSEYERLIAGSEPHRFEPVDEDAIASSFYTTGTTGMPKAVSFSHRQLVLHTLSTSIKLASQAPFGMASGDVYMPITPMFHGHAWGMPYAATLMGLKQVYPGRYDPIELLELKQREGVTFSHCVPTILQMLIDAAKARGDDLTGWSMAIGGSAMTEHLLMEARGVGISAFQGFGLSEACPNLTLSRPLPSSADADADARLCWAGVAFPLVEFRLLDGAGEALPHDGVSEGELVVRAPWLTQGYAGNSEASAELWRGGWMHTQDVATIDPLGYVRIRDRLKDVIKSGGEWISSLLLENLIQGMPGVREVAVVAVADDRWGERPVAVIVPACEPVPLEAVRAHLDPLVREGTLSRFALPDRVVTRDTLPKTSVGKIDKKALRRDCAV